MILAQVDSVTYFCVPYTHTVRYAAICDAIAARVNAGELSAKLCIAAAESLDCAAATLADELRRCIATAAEEAGAAEAEIESDDFRFTVRFCTVQHGRAWLTQGSVPERDYSAAHTGEGYK